MDIEVVKRLEKFALSVTEDGGVELDLRDIRGSEDLCEKSLVGRIFGEHNVNYTGLKQTMTKLWCEEGELKVIELKNEMYQFVFTREEDKERVLEKRPWTFDNRMLVIQPWRKDIDNDPKAFCSTQMWVQAWQIPVQWLSTETVWKLGRIFNKCIKVVIPENGSKEGRYARLLVEIDLMKPLIRGTKLRCNGEMRWVEFRYENLPLFCFYCGLIGHGDRMCGKKKEDSLNSKLNEGQFGEWIRGSNGRGFNKARNWGKKEEGNLLTGQNQIVEERSRSRGEGGNDGVTRDKGRTRGAGDGSRATERKAEEKPAAPSQHAGG